MPEPAHHAEYRRAWGVHSDPNSTVEEIMKSEQDMDNAQNSFMFFEFNLFIKTLDGYNSHSFEFLDFHLERTKEHIELAEIRGERFVNGWEINRLKFDVEMYIQHRRSQVGEHYSCDVLEKLDWKKCGF